MELIDLQVDNRRENGRIFQLHMLAISACRRHGILRWLTNVTIVMEISSVRMILGTCVYIYI